MRYCFHILKGSKSLFAGLFLIAGHLQEDVPILPKINVGSGAQNAKIVSYYRVMVLQLGFLIKQKKCLIIKSGGWVNFKI